MELYQDNGVVYDDLVLRQERTDVYDDYTADKALERLEQAKKDFDRAKEIGLRRIEEITAQMQAAEERYHKIAQPIKQQLTAYLRTADCRETKTRYSYQLLSGKVLLKKPTQKLVPDRKALTEYLQESGQTKYIKLAPEPAWGEYKKRLKIVGDTVIDVDTGEVVPAVTVEDVPEELTWEV